MTQSKGRLALLLFDIRRASLTVVGSLSIKHKNIKYIRGAIKEIDESEDLNLITANNEPKEEE